MKLKMHENSLFAVLLRSPWWISAAVAGGIFMLMRIWLPVEFAVFGASPFAAIAIYVAWRQLRQPSAEQVARKLEAIRGMPADAFAQALEAGFRREGYGVTRMMEKARASVDLEVSKGGRVSLVVCKRWKAATTGVGPLEELEALRQKQKADEGVFVTAGDVSEQARKYAAAKSIRIIEGSELANLTA